MYLNLSLRMHECIKKCKYQIHFISDTVLGGQLIGWHVPTVLLIVEDINIRAVTNPNEVYCRISNPDHVIHKIYIKHNKTC